MESNAESHIQPIDYGQVVSVQHPGGAPQVLVICEHASNRVPDGLDALGLSPDALQRHIAWDPGAFGVARPLAKQLQGVLICGGVSRLVYDCNRPPEAPSAIPARSEIFDIPGNIDLSPAARTERVREVYDPFRMTVADHIGALKAELRLMITVHSFTPIYQNEPRDVEIGILHGRDDRFATAMLRDTDHAQSYVTRLNEPYSAADGVAHTLDLHGFANGLMNVMIEIRNDLIRTPKQQTEMAAHLAPWIGRALSGFESRGAL